MHSFYDYSLFGPATLHFFNNLRSYSVVHYARVTFLFFSRLISQKKSRGMNPTMYQKKPASLANQSSVYRPVISIQRISAHEKLYSKLLIATVDTPTDVCGTAKRIGITGTGEIDLVLYRIKLWTDQKRLNYMLPSLFVVEDGIFLDVDSWQSQQQNLQSLFDTVLEQQEQQERAEANAPAPLVEPAYDEQA
jgi:hypothetical protein